MGLCKEVGVGEQEGKIRVATCAASFPGSPCEGRAWERGYLCVVLYTHCSKSVLPTMYVALGKLCLIIVIATVLYNSCVTTRN